MFKLVSEKAEEPEIKLPTSAGSWKKQQSSRETSISALLTVPKPLTIWITINCGKFWKRWEYQTTWPASWETYMQVRKQQLELDMGDFSGSPVVKTLPSKAGGEGSTPGRELRSYMPQGQKTKTQNRSNLVTDSIKTFKNGPHQKKQTNKNHNNKKHL